MSYNSDNNYFCCTECSGSPGTVTEQEKTKNGKHLGQTELPPGAVVSPDINLYIVLQDFIWNDFIFGVFSLRKYMRYKIVARKLFKLYNF